MELTAEQVAQYGGILDLIPGVGDLIQKLTPIIQQKIVRAKTRRAEIVDHVSLRYGYRGR